MLKLELIGNLGKDSEVKVINGKNYSSFPVAVSEGYGENKRTTWVNVLKFAGENDKLGQYLTKGTKVYVSGKPSVSAYTNKNNEPSSDISLWANDLELVGGIQSNETAQNTSPVESPKPAIQNDLPFYSAYTHKNNSPAQNTSPVESPQPAGKNEKIEIKNDLPF